MLAIAYRTPDGTPGVVKTAPTLPDGTPFPTLYYLTDPRLTAEASRQESAGVMREMTERSRRDPELARRVPARARSRTSPSETRSSSLGTDFTGGGMPDRVKCLHVLMAHSLAKGPGVNPLGDESVALAAPRQAQAARHRDSRGLARHRRRREVTSSDRVAAVDCGTNSIRLLIADVDADGHLHDVRREMRVVRLGQGVDATGRLAPEAIERTRVALSEYAGMIARHRRRPRSGWSPRRPPATRPTARTSSR